MSWVRMMISKVEGLFQRDRAEREMNEEMQSHLAMLADENLKKGMSPEEARRAALRSFGGVEQAKESYRDQRRLPFLESFIQDTRYGVRQLRRSPGFTVVAVLTLALGIGANTTIFSYVNTLLLRPPSGVVAPGKLFAVWNRLPGGGYRQQSYPDYIYYRDHNRVFSGLAAYSSDPERASWRVGGETTLVYGQLVSIDLFSVLGVKPSLGRGFLPAEGQVPLRDAVMVLSHTFWRNRLNSDSGIVGKTLVLNGRSFRVLGVAPAGFNGVETGFVPDFWVPLAMQSQISPGMDLLTNRTGYWLFAVGRLKPGVTTKQAQADLGVLEKQLAESFPQTNKGWDAAVAPVAGLPPEFSGYAVPFTGLVMAVVGLVLLIACANAANLLLARATRRSREMAVRSALGASRARILRQMLTESILLSLAAGGVALWLSGLAGPLLLNLKPAILSFIRIPLPLDWRVLVFTFGVSLIAGFVFGIAPALRSSKADVVSRLKDDLPGSRAGSRLRNILVTGQVAVCTVLLIAAGLCLRSLMTASSVNPGFRVKNRLEVTVDLSMLSYSEARGKAFYERLAEEVKALPGVETASVANYLPLGFKSMGTAVSIEGFQPPAGWPGMPVGFMAVGPDYFRTMGTTLLRGREFTPQDIDGSPGVAIINEAMAKRYWSGQDPIGKQITLAFGKRQRLEIVGIVETGKYQHLGEAPQPLMFQPFSQVYAPQAVLVAHTQGDADAVLSAIERDIHALDPNLLVLDAETLAQYMSIPLFLPRLTGTLLGVFGFLALLLATVGLSGVVAYFVSLRTQEIGVHIALGAERLDVLKLVVKQGMRLSILGVVIGLAAALGATRALSSLLFGIRPTDPITYVSVALFLIIVTVLACYLPARRATKVDPVVALRHE